MKNNKKRKKSWSQFKFVLLCLVLSSPAWSHESYTLYKDVVWAKPKGFALTADLENSTTVNEIVEDAFGAVLWVQSNIHRYNGDASKVVVTGDSAGGIKVHAAILSYAGFDLYATAQNGYETNSNPFWAWAGAEPRGMFGKGISTESHPEYYKKVSPVYYLNEKTSKDVLPRQLVLVGELDRMTTPKLAREYVEKFENLEQRVEFKVYDGKGHGFLDAGCNDYNNGCFDELSRPAVQDMLVFLQSVEKE